MIATKLLPVLTEDTLAEYIRFEAWLDFRSDRCVCSNPKTPGLAFCRPCWKKLPVEIRRRIFGPGVGRYTESYRRAVEWLRGEQCP